MDQIYKDVEKKIKTKHSFGWTPKYKTIIKTSLKKEIVTEVATRAFEKLGWELTYKDRESTEAYRKNSEKIIIKALLDNKIQIESVTLGNEMWDMGRNSKRVRLFEFAFREEERNFDPEKQTELHNEIQIKDNWDDYIIPTFLPIPERRREPTFAIPVIGGLLIALIFAFLTAYLTVNVIYIIMLYESIIGMAFGFSLKYLIKWGNFTNSEKLLFLIYAMIAVFFITNQIFQYQIIISQNDITGFSFFDFIKLRFESGLKIKSLNTGWIGLIISWILQVLIIYWITILRAFSSLLVYQSERIPREVVEFAYYHFVKEKSEQEVRGELSKMGWSNEVSQNEIFEALGAVYERQNFLKSS